MHSEKECLSWERDSVEFGTGDFRPTSRASPVTLLEQIHTRSSSVLEVHMSHVPQDFPRRADIRGVVPGGQPMVCLVRTDEMYVVPSDEDEREERWELCEDLARQLCHVAFKDATRRSHDETLARVRDAVRRRSWMTSAELNWVMQRLVALLGW